VISIILVNGLPHWLVIKNFLQCSTSKHLLTWLYSCHIRIGMKTLGWLFTLISTLLMMWKEIVWAHWYTYYHIDPLCIVFWLCFFILYIHYVILADTISSCHGSIDKHCIFSGYTFQSIWSWICSVFYGSHTFKVLYQSSIGMPALGLKHVIKFVWWLFAASTRFSNSIPFLW